MNQEQLLSIWLDTQPTARSPYTLYGCPPMWETLRDEEDDVVLFSRPGTVQERPAPLMPYEEVPGVHYQWQRDGKWVGQGCQSTFAFFEQNGPGKIDIPPLPRRPAFSGEFNWNERVAEPVMVLPFVEGVPSQAKAAALSKWLKRHADRYRKTFVRMYHATDPSLAIEEQGLKPTSATRRRSYQSESGYVYLSNTPARAKNFGDLGNGSRSVVFEVILPVRDPRADTDQLNNQRAAGHEVGNTVGESIVYGGGVRVKGRIEPWAVRRLSEAQCAQIEERNARMWQMERLAGQPGLAPVFLECAAAALLRAEGSLYDTDWREVERTFVRSAVMVHGGDADQVRKTILSCSPIAVVPKHVEVIEWDIGKALRERGMAGDETSRTAAARKRPGR